MNENNFQHIYGPVPSRRLGRSLGIDLVPLKTCTYDCVYCQLGRTTNKTIERKEYVAIEEVLAELEKKLSVGPSPDYITLAGSGEPTLNNGIGHLIHRIKNLTNIPVTVLTNGSLLWMSEVQEDLMMADVILPDLDAGDERLFQYVNRPHAGISFEQMVEGIAAFTRRFPGQVWLEVFLLGGITGIPAEVEKIAAIAQRIQPERIQLNTVTRPPAEESARQVPADQMECFRKFFSKTAEVIAENELDEPSSKPAQEVTDTDIVALLSRRPCTVKDISSGLRMNASEVIKRLQVLSQKGIVVSIRKNNAIFYEAARK